MANRYWTGAVNGGTGTWDASNTTNWSTTSGGAGGASVPTSSDAVFFDVNSSSGVCSLGTNVNTSSINFTNYTGTFNFETYKVSVFGNGTTILNFGNSVTFTGNKLFDLVYSGSTGTRTITGSFTSSPGGVEANVPDVNISAGSDTIAGGASYRNLNFTGFSGAFTPASQSIFGDITLSSTMSINSNTNPLLFASTNATPRNITSNGVTLNCQLRFQGVGGAWVLQDDLTVASNRLLRLTNGTFNANNKNVVLGGFITFAGTKTLVMGSGTWTVTGDNATLTTVWDANNNATNFTVVPGTAIINMTSANAKTFAGAARTWPTLNQGGAGALTVQQSNTFANITNTVQPATITLASGTTQTVTEFDVSGTSGNLITLNASTAGSRATLTDNGGINSVSFVDIKDIAATGYGEWQAYTSNGNVDSGNNLGWVFVEPPPLTASEYQISLKSFTERRSF